MQVCSGVSAARVRMHNIQYDRSLTAPSAASAGLQLLTESYVVLIHAFLGAGNVQGAVELYKSMQRQGYDVRAGWLMLTSELFRHGCATAGVRSREMRLHVWVVNTG